MFRHPNLQSPFSGRSREERVCLRESTIIVTPSAGNNVFSLAQGLSSVRHPKRHTSAPQAACCTIAWTAMLGVGLRSR